MPKPFDATLKHLIADYPADWLARFGVPMPEPPEVLSADFSTVTAAADTLIRAGRLVVHIDVQAGPDAGLAKRMLVYNVLAHRHTGLPVRSIVVLLRPNALRANLTDRVEYEGLRFRFEIVRVWETPAEEWLSGGVGLMPLAVLGKPPAGRTRAQALPELVHRMADRADREAPRSAPQLMTSAHILSGMHVEAGVSRAIFQRVLAMRESSTYLAILEEGAIEHTQNLLLKMGQEKYGDPTPEQTGKLKAVQKLDRLDRLALRLVKVDSWDALLKGR